MAAVIHSFEPVRRTLPPAAPQDPANRARQSPGTRTDSQGSSCNDAILISSDDDSDDDFDDSQSDASFPPVDEIKAPCKGGRHDVNSTPNDAGRLSLGGAAHAINRSHAIVEVPQQTSQAANGSGMTEPASSPTCELPGSPSVSVRAYSDTPAPEHDANGGACCGMARDQDGSLKSKTPERSPDPRKGTSLPDDSCNQDGMQALEDIGGATQPQHGRCRDIDDGEDGSVETSPADFTPHLQASSTRLYQTEHAGEDDGAIDSPCKALGALIGNTIVGQLDDDEGDGDESGGADDDDDDDEEDGDDGTCLDDVSTPLTEVTAASSDTPDRESDHESDNQSDTQSDTQPDGPAQLPSPPKYSSPQRSCGRRGRAVHRVGIRAPGDGDTASLQLQHRPHQDLRCSGDEVVLDEEEGDDDPQPPRKRRRISTLRRRASTPSASRSPAASRGRNIRKHPTSHDPSRGDMAADTVQAEYKEWALHDVVLKRVTEGGRTVFQLQFAWDSRPQHLPNAYGRQRASARVPGVSCKFTGDEDALLVQLKEEDCLRWSEIHKRFSEQFGGRSRGALQVHYSTKLKGRACRKEKGHRTR